MILNITEIYDCMQNMDQLALSCYLNFIIGAIQIQTGAGSSMGQTARILQQVPYSTLDLGGTIYYESVFDMNEGIINFH